MLQIKDWFLRKNATTEEYSACRNGGHQCQIMKETEKAYLLKVITDFGSFQMWAPKSCTEDTDEIEAEDEDLPIEDEVAKLQKIDDLVENHGLDFWTARDLVDMTEDKRAEKLANIEAKRMSGLEYNELLKRFCKEHGIKCGNGRVKTSTLIEKIKNAGLEAPARA